MFTQHLRKAFIIPALAAGCLAAAAMAHANDLKSLSVEPTFECAGIIATLTGTDDPGTVRLEVKGPGEAGYRAAHDFVRYDNYHLASSLFNLLPGTTYTVRATLGSRSMTSTFTTRPEFSLPAPLRTVPVSTVAALKTALAAAQPGDEIVLAPGTYRSSFTVTQSGTPEHPIVVRGAVADSEKAKQIDKRTGLPVIDGTGADPVILVTGSNVVLDDLRLENISLDGIRLEATGHDVVQNCQVTGASNGWNHFIYVEGGGANGGRHLIQGNYVADSGTGAGYGIYQNNLPGPGTVIRRNIITGCYDGINPSGNEQDLNDANLPETHPDVLASWPNHSTDVYENTIHISRDDGIEMDGIAVNERVFRNAICPDPGDHCTNAISIAPVAPGPFFFVRNLLINYHEGAVKYNTASNRGTIRNCYFYHNTIKNDQGTENRGTLLTLWEGAGDAGSPSKNTNFKNNIFAGDKMLVQRLVTVHTPNYAANLWHTTQASGTLYQWGKTGPYYASFDEWRKATGEEPQGLYADPKVGSDFHLTAGSPAIDKGVRIPGINDTYSGAAPDMGAFEYGSSGAPVGTDETNPPAPVQLFTISGYARDAAQAAVPGAIVRLNGTTAKAAVTDASGLYRFTGVPEGSYTVSIEKPGCVFSPSSKTVPQASSFAGSLDFALTATEVAANLDKALGFPNPWMAGKASSPCIAFQNLTKGTRVRIFTLTGALVKELYDADKTEILWDVSGDGIASGVYVCALSNDKGQKKRLKVAVIK